MKGILLFTLLVLLTFAPFASAQEDLMTIQEEAVTEETEELEEEPEDKAAYGEVSAVDEDARTITILQFDYELEEEVGVTYVVEDDAEIEGVETLGEIHEGDWVDIEYEVNKDDEKKTDFIAVEAEPLFEEDEEEDEEDLGQPEDIIGTEAKTSE
ncbi:MAG: hypothetical protein ISS34_03675 [Candidatus Omnitrophica bacterium]|nr:hypothetical protein [Candidatus Omnitrophota bacterium]